MIRGREAPMHAGRLDELLLAQRDHLGRARPGRSRSSPAPLSTRTIVSGEGPRPCRDDRQDGDRGHDQEQVGDPHDHLVDPAAEVAGHRAQRPSRRAVASSGDAEADRQRDLPGVEHLAEVVAAEVVGAQPVRAGRRSVGPTSEVLRVAAGTARSRRRRSSRPPAAASTISAGDREPVAQEAREATREVRGSPDAVGGPASGRGAGRAVGWVITGLTRGSRSA